MNRKDYIDRFSNYPDWLLNKWQLLIDMVAHLLKIPSTLIMKTENEHMEVFLSSNSPGNPYKTGDSEKWLALYCEAVIKSQEKLYVRDTNMDKNRNENPDLKPGIISYLGYPINFPDKVPFGTICILDQEENSYSDVHKNLLLQIRNNIEEDLKQLQMISEKESEISRLSTAIEQSANMVVITNLDGNIEFVNKRFSELTGYAFDEVRGENPRILKSGMQSDEFYEKMWGTINSGKIWEGELCNKTKSGEFIWERLTITPIKDEKDEIINYLAIKEDITEKKAIEKNANDYKEKLEGIFENLDDVFFQTDKQGLINFVNPAAKDMFGYEDSESLIGIHLKQLIVDKGQLSDIFDQLKTKSRINDHIVKGRRKDLTDIWCSLSIKVLYDDEKQIKGYIGLIRDVTMLVAQEKELLNAKNRAEESETKLKMILNESEIGILIVDTTDLKIIEFNNKIYQQLGYSKDEFSKLYLTDLHPDGFKENINILKELKRSGFSKFETRNIKKNGELIEVLITAKIIKIGKKQYYQCIIDNITEKKRYEKDILYAKEKAEKNESLMKEAQATAHVGNWELDLLTNTLYWSDEIYRIFNCSPDDFQPTIERTIDFVHPHDREYVNKVYDEHLLLNKPYDLVYRVLLKDNVVKFLYEKSSTKIDDEGKHIRLRGIISDITELKMTEMELIKAKEKAEESDRLKSAFLANMSHEIRTPMNGIIGFINLLSDPEYNESEKNEFIDVVNKSSERLMNTINDLIEISKIEIGDIQVNYERVNIEELLYFYHDLFKLEAQRKGIELKLSLVPSNREIYTDKHLIDGIIMNLIKNAIKFTMQGTIEFGNYYQNSNEICFYVNDTGIGISENKLETIFDRFVQANDSFTRDIEGAGLGLSIVKAYVDALRGKIEVNSNLNKGTKFVVTLPI